MISHCFEKPSKIDFEVQASFVARNAYCLFNHHVSDNGYDKPGQIAPQRDSPLRWHYACITAGACEDKELRVLLARIQKLDVSVVNPLLMSFFEDYVGDALSHDDFASMLRDHGELPLPSRCL